MGETIPENNESYKHETTKNEPGVEEPGVEQTTGRCQLQQRTGAEYRNAPTEIRVMDETQVAK